MAAVDDHRGEIGLHSALSLIPIPSNPDTGTTSGNSVLYVDSDDSLLHYKSPTGTESTVPVNDALLVHLAGVEAFTGAKQFSAGIAPAATLTTPRWSGGIGVLLATAGNDTACTAGDIYWAPIFVPCNETITGINYLIGSVGGTDKAIVALYSATGVLLANSALAGTTVGTAANFQPLDFVSPYAAIGPAVYYVAVQFNGTTAKFRTHTIPGQKIVTGTQAGAFGTLAAITPGTTYTANKGPLAVTY